MFTSKSSSIILSLLLAFAVVSGCTDTELLAPEPPTETAVDGSENAFAKRGVSTETAQVMGQGIDGPAVADAEATIRRTPNGISAGISMPTPEPGTYIYPADADEGHPEAFTLWIIWR